MKKINIAFIKAIKLLSAEEYKNAQVTIYTDESMCWWLRTPGTRKECVAYVSEDGLDEEGMWANGHILCIVRPVLILAPEAMTTEGDNFKVGDYFKFGENEWEIISDEAENGGEILALCTSYLWSGPFCEDMEKAYPNDYETSDLKMELEAWLKETLFDSRVKVYSLDLLSVEEYLKYKSRIKNSKHPWWLRTPGRGEDKVCFVDQRGIVNETGSFDFQRFARPVMTFNMSEIGISVGESFQFRGSQWTAIDADLAIQDSARGVDFRNFDERRYEYDRELEDYIDTKRVHNDYAVSDVKSWLMQEKREMAH